MHTPSRPKEVRLTTTKKTEKVLAIGNFDGIHLGHQRMLAQVKTLASTHQLASATLSFTPHPKEFFEQKAGHAKSHKYIFTLRDKCAVIKSLGIEHIYIQRFNQGLAQLSAEEFIRKILVDDLQCRHIVVGDDFRFGAKRTGDVDLLKKLATQYHYQVHITPPVLYNDEKVSSSRIRSRLAEADFVTARALLGRNYCVSGRVIHGQKLGRTIGYPTLNIRTQELVLHGIYAVKVHGITDQPMLGVASLGYRPSVFSTGEYLLEVYLLDFNQSLYGQIVSVEFMTKLRDEQTFANLEELTQAIGADVEQTRQYFAALEISGASKQPY